MSKRLIWFFMMMVFGAAAGVGIGWYAQPILQNNGAIPGGVEANALRADYQTDYVLMVAEAYAAQADLPAAIDRLALLQGRSPARGAAEAMIAAQKLNYAQSDLEKLARLAQALQTNTTLTPTETQP